ncbi:Toll/interleukin-1 receptor domain-containing protein [Tanacetum coccineum]
MEMVVDVDTSAHGIWKRLKDLLHNYKDARVTQLDNEIRNMSIGSSFIADFFQDIKSKANHLVNLDSPMKDTSLVTYAINGIRSKYPDAARVIRLREKVPTFDELRSMMLLEESDMLHQSVSPSLLHNPSSSPTVLVASTTPHDKANTMATSGFNVCHNFQRGSCSYGAHCKFVHGANDLRPRPSLTSSTTQGRFQPTSVNRTQQTKTNVASKATVPIANRTIRQSCVAQSPQVIYLHQPTNMGYVYFNTGPSYLQPAHPLSLPTQQPNAQAHQFTFGATGPLQPCPPGGIPSVAAPQFQQ